MRLFNTRSGILIQKGGAFFLVKRDWNTFINDDALFKKSESFCTSENREENGEKYLAKDQLLKPIGSQEIWASGVTYYNSKMARQEESKDSGGADFYAKVYAAERPELFFKSTASRAVGHMEKIAIRKDSHWNVPEPELTLLITSSGRIVAYTIGNDVSSRSIEGENPLYLPQAKVYDRSAAIGPCILVLEDGISEETEIKMQISRASNVVFEGRVRINQIVRKFEDLAEYLYKEMSFENGCFLMTGTGIVPDSQFTLEQNDEVYIEVEGIGRLINYVG